MLLEIGGLNDIGKEGGCPLWRFVLEEVTAGVYPSGISGVDTSTLVASGVSLCNSTLAGETRLFLEKDEPAKISGRRKKKDGG